VTLLIAFRAAQFFALPVSIIDFGGSGFEGGDEGIVERLREGIERRRGHGGNR